MLTRSVITGTWSQVFSFFCFSIDQLMTLVYCLMTSTYVQLIMYIYIHKQLYIFRGAAALVFVFVMRRAIKSKAVDSQAPQKSTPLGLLGLAWRAKASLSLKPAQHIHYLSTRVSPSSSTQPMTAGALRLLPVSFDAALVGFDVSINAEEPGTESL